MKRTLNSCLPARSRLAVAGGSTLNYKSGFTLIELLIVIGILGILAIAIVTALNVVGNLNKASLARAKTFSASVENALSINQVGKWSFEETGSPFKDTSGYGNDGLCLGASCPTSKTASECDLGFGRCLQFDGGDDYITLGTNNIFNESGSTIQFWLRPLGLGGPSGYMIIVRFKVPSGFEFLFSIGSIGNTQQGGVATYFGFRTQNAIYSNDTKAYLNNFQNQWKHFAVSYNGGNKGLASSYKAYVDGAPIPLSTSGGIGGSANENQIGINQGGGGWINGYLDEVAIYNQALTAYQIHQLYVQGLPRHQLVRQAGK